MHFRNELNLGQLVREKLGTNKSYLIGQITYTGTVTAAHEWGDPPERMQVRLGMKGSYEDLLHQAGLPAYWLNLRSENDATKMLKKENRLMRYIGVIYAAKTERQSHYYRGHVTKQFDALIYYEHTRAVEPMERESDMPEAEVPQTFPAGL
eukprot:jgi/Chlat1/5922/Chrsp4S06253